MSTALSVPARSTSSRRTAILAVASGVVAAASITLTLAVGSGGRDVISPPSQSPGSATPDRATLYRHGAELPQPSGAIDGKRAAERFHHFR
jgi:hypothetical protein